MPIKLDTDTFIKRLNRIHSSLLENKVSWNYADCLCLNHGLMNEDDIYAKSLVLQNYLFDVELTDTVMLITHDKKVYFLSSKKKIEFLEQLMDAEDRGGFTYNFMMRDKSSGNERHYCKIIKAIESVTSSEENGNIRVGVFAKEWECNKDTVNVSGLQKAISDSDILEIVDVGVGFGIALGVKDQKELNLIEESSIICNSVLSFHVIPRLEEILYTEEKITHEALAEEIEDMYQDLGKINLEIAPDQVSTAYFPIIQSGGEYDMHISALSDSKILKYDIIIVSFGTRYNNYCSNIARTFLIDPPKMVSETYQLLLQMYYACLKVMVPGKPLKSVYETAVQKLMDTGREHLVKCLPKNLGFSIGAYFREGSLALSAKNNVIFKAGMTFNLAIGMSGIPLLDTDKNHLSDASGINKISNYALLVADTVVITESGAKAMTNHDKSLSGISFTNFDMVNDDANTADGDKEDDDQHYDYDQSKDETQSRNISVASKEDHKLMRDVSPDDTECMSSSKLPVTCYNIRQNQKHRTPEDHCNEPAYNWRYQSSSSYSSGICRNNSTVILHDSEAEKDQKITRLLAVRSYHLPGYNCCQDYISWFKNNHPLLGLCCKHKLNPIGTSPRIIILLSSIFFGLIATNLVYLFYDGPIVKIDISDDPNAYLYHFEVSTESVVLWTFGGIVHSIIDLALWYLTACACCLPGGVCSFESGKWPLCKHVGSYIVVMIFFALTALATLLVLLRATYEENGGIMSNSTEVDGHIRFIKVTSLTSFTFLVTFAVELLLTYLVWGPLVSTILFLGVLRGCIPFLDSRPKEVERERSAAREAESIVLQRT